MLALFVLGLALLVGVMLLGRWYVSVEPKALVKAFKWFSLIILVVVTLFMLLTGRLTWALFALPALFGWFMRFRSVARTAKNFSRMAGGGGKADDDTSEIKTGFFKMVLNHASGHMDGEIISGTYRGKWLKDLGENDLLSLLQECRRGDEQSVLVLEAYLDRNHPGWRRRDGQDSAGSGRADPSMDDAMDRNQALRVLDLPEDATDDQIKEAHHRLMSRLHPDHGGSTYLASKINQAKDVLLAK